MFCDFNGGYTGDENGDGVLYPGKLDQNCVVIGDATFHGLSYFKIYEISAEQ